MIQTTVKAFCDSRLPLLCFIILFKVVCPVAIQMSFTKRIQIRAFPE